MKYRFRPPTTPRPDDGDDQTAPRPDDDDDPQIDKDERSFETGNEFYAWVFGLIMMGIIALVFWVGSLVFSCLKGAVEKFFG